MPLCDQRNSASVMADEQEHASRMPEGLHALASIVLGDSNMESVLDRTCEVAKDTITGAREVSVTLTENGAPRTAAFSGELALRVDETQYATGHGPCLEAARTGQTIIVGDLRVEANRWPDYSRPAMEAGIRASISAPLRIAESVIGALNIY